MNPAMRRGLLAAVVVAPVPVSWTVFFLPMGGLRFFPRIAVTVAAVLVSASIAFWAVRRFRLLDPAATSLRSLFAGLVSPGIAAMLGLLTYAVLTGASADPDSDFVFRLSATAGAMTLPFAATLALAGVDGRRQPLGLAGKLGVALAAASLALTWVPINGLLVRQRQAANSSLSGVEAPPFHAVDIHGKPHRLSEHRGKVVLVNIWATWCGPCRREMPDLDRLYQARKGDGLMVFGFSTEDAELQRQFAEDVLVTYPLLTVQPDVPGIYSEAARYPANLLIDRNGRLRPAPGADEPFSSLEAAVDALLAAAVENQ